jgi:hypothetical protein
VALPASARALSFEDKSLTSCANLFAHERKMATDTLVAQVHTKEVPRPSAGARLTNK